MSAVQETSYLMGAYDHTGPNREDLANWISNISPHDTPLMNSLGRTTARSTYHEWLIDTLAAVGDRGIQEGLDWSPANDTAPSRPVNWTEIFLKNTSVSETQREIVAAGFSDAYAYQVEKRTKEIMREGESALMNAGSTATASGTTGRIMKSLEDFLTTNVYTSDDGNYETDLDSTAAAALMTEVDFNSMLQDIYTAGGHADLVVGAPAYKRQISNFTANSKNTRYIGAAQKEVVVGLDLIDTDFGAVAIQLNRWSPVGTNTTSGTACAATNNDLTGRIWFLERAKVRTAWLRALKHRLMGVRGDSTVGQVVCEFTLEVGNEAACGVLKGVNNKSLVSK